MKRASITLSTGFVDNPCKINLSLKSDNADDDDSVGSSSSKQMLDYKTQWRRSFGIQYFVATWMKQDTSAYASRGWRFMCQSTDVEKYSNHSKNQGEKSNRYRVIRNSSVIGHWQSRLSQTEVTPTSMRELRLRSALRFVDYLAFFFSGATTLRFESPHETNFCETTRHH